VATRERLHALVAQLAPQDLAVAERVLAALVGPDVFLTGGAPPRPAQRETSRGLCLLSIAEACRRLGGISRDSFDRDRELRAHVQSATRRRVGIREDVLEAIIARRAAVGCAPGPVGASAPSRYRRHRRAAAAPPS
jgi:hypothetical protein